MSSSPSQPHTTISPVVLKQLSINSSSLSITSIRFNPPYHHHRGNGGVSPWVGSLFGKHSVFWESPPSATTKAKIVNWMEQGKPDPTIRSFGAALNHSRHHDIVQHHLQYVSIEDWLSASSCSIELFGFVLTDTSRPFLIEEKYLAPSIGFGIFSVNLSGKIKHTNQSTNDNSKKSVSIGCLFRATHDNWRNSEAPETKPHFWPIFLICPSAAIVPSSNDLKSFATIFTSGKHASPDMQNELCSQLIPAHSARISPSSTTKGNLRKAQSEQADSKSFQSLQHKLYIQLKPSTTKWSSVIETVINEHYPIDLLNNYLFSSSPIDYHTLPTTQSTKKLSDPSQTHVVCTAIPYKTINPEKVEAVNAILFEWIRYYTVMGFKVIIYDRDGWNYHDLFQSDYVKYKENVSKTVTKKTWDIIHKNLIYYNYTLLSRLTPPTTMNEYKYYDNAEGVTDAVVKFDDDHTLSLTHCRVDAWARFGYSHVLINDFDEFLYCRGGTGDSISQKAFLHQYLNLMMQSGYNQIGFPQRIVKHRKSFDEQGRLRVNETMEECVIRQVQSTKQSTTTLVGKAQHKVHAKDYSVFKCFAPYGEVLDKNWPKSIHFGLNCPLTTDHAACASSPPEIRHYNCLCTATLSTQCSLLHLSMKEVDYRDQEDNIEEVGNSLQPPLTNEIGSMLLEI